MSWNEIHQAMESYRPSFENGDERLKIMKSLDRLICYSVKHVGEEDRQKLKPWLQEMVPFYRRRVDRGLDARPDVHHFTADVGARGWCWCCE